MKLRMIPVDSHSSPIGLLQERTYKIADNECLTYFPRRYNPPTLLRTPLHKNYWVEGDAVRHGKSCDLTLLNAAKIVFLAATVPALLRVNHRRDGRTDGRPDGRTDGRTDGQRRWQYGESNLWLRFPSKLN